MNLEIVESDEASADVIEAADYLALNGSLDISDRFIKAVQGAYDLLATMPGAVIVRDYGNPAITGMRMWPVPHFHNYLVFYLTSAEELRVVRVLNGAQDIEAIFNP